jgi:DNA-binding MarR family transcriptional regulator
MANEELTNLIVEFYDKVSSWEHAVVKDQGVTLEQAHTIETLGSSGALRMKELASKMGITTGTLTVNIDKLEKLGYVERVPNKKDRRSILVQLTDDGKKLFDEHHELHLRLTTEITANLTEDESALVTDILKKIVASF